MRISPTPPVDQREIAATSVGSPYRHLPTLADTPSPPVRRHTPTPARTPALSLVPHPATPPTPGLPLVDLPAALQAAFGRPCIVTSSGREALARILAALRLRSDDEVWITTTMGSRGLQVSPCVTATVASCCRFAFDPGPRTAAVLVIHDYGVPHPHLDEIAARCRRQGWPLIEDAAHAFAGQNGAGRRLGTTGDFALFSLPKFFSLTRGGLALGLGAGRPDWAVDDVWGGLAAWLPQTPAIAAARRATWKALDTHMRALGLECALPLPPGAVPSLYVLRTPRPLAALRLLRAAGIETGPDVNRRDVFLPCHQQVTAADVARMLATIEASMRATPASALLGIALR